MFLTHLGVRFGLCVCLLAERIRLSICQPLADDAEQCSLCACQIIHAELHTIVVAEIKLRQVAVQMLFATVLVDTRHAALEQAEVALNRARVDRGIVRIDVFTLGVVDAAVARHLFADLAVVTS